MDKEDRINHKMEAFNESQPLAEAIESFLAREPAYFCTPGHRFGRGVSESLSERLQKEPFRYDLTETYGLDDLHAPCGAIREAQSLAAKLYGASQTWFLVNGSTCGIEALCLACLREGEEAVVARNAHASLVSGLVLSGAKPAWIVPDMDGSFGFATALSKEKLKRALNDHPKARAVFIVSPTYHGVCSDIEALADICHDKDIPLIVDEAHGAHLYFNDKFPEGALRHGADAVVMSTHKTLFGMTQASMLHIQGDRIDRGRLEAALKVTMSSSPSYLLMSSLDVVRCQMANEGHKIMGRAHELSMRMRVHASNIQGIEVFGGADPAELLRRRIDSSRVVFSAKALGLAGYELSDILFERHSIALETADALSCTAIVTAANTDDDIDRVINALREISKEGGREAVPFGGLVLPPPKVKMSPREAFFEKSESVRLKDALGRVSAESVSPYPPGIPIINPGEVIDEGVVSAIERCLADKIKLHSDSEKTGYIRVVQRRQWDEIHIVECQRA